MKIIELNHTHVDAVLPLFYIHKYMGVSAHSNYFVDTQKDTFEELYHRAFKETYLTGLTSYKSLGMFDDEGNIKSLIAFYISPDEPAWYGTQIRSLKDKNYVAPLLDAAMAYNEKEGRCKFYTLWSNKHSKVLRRFAFSKEANERYDYFDECKIPAKTKAIYTNHWHILFNRILIPTDSIVRCTFLKREYRTELHIGGNI
jgi:hypothetical protein